LAEAGRFAEAEAEFTEAVRLDPDDPGYRAGLGRALAEAGRFAEAEAEFTEAVRLDPDDPGYRAGLGRALAEAGRFAEAEAEFGEAARLDPANPAHPAGLGRAQAAQARFAEAETAFRQAARLDPANPAHLAGLGRAQAAQARFAEAETAFRQAARLDPANPAHLAGLGRAQAAQARFAEAETAFRQAARLDPANPAHPADRGRALAAQARFAEAEAAFRQAARLDPANPAYLAGLGRALLSQKRVAEAEASILDAMRLDPANPAYRADLGQVLLSQGRHSGAEKVFREAMRLDPANPAYLAGLGRALSAQGHYAQAERLFREAVQLDDHAAEYRADLGRSLSAEGRHTEADRLFREAIRLDPANPAYLADLGRTLLSQKRATEAEASILEAVRLDPANPAYQADLGRALAAQGRHAEADDALREAVRLDPANPAYRADLGRALTAQGRHAEAENRFREAIQLDPDDAAFRADVGHALATRHRYADAEAAFQEAVRLDPANLAFRARLGQMMLSQQKLGQAEIILREVLQLDPEAADAQVADLKTALTTAHDAAIADYALGSARRRFGKEELERRGVTQHQYIDQVAVIVAQQLPNLRDAYRAWAEAGPVKPPGLQRRRFLTFKFMPGLCLLIAALTLAALVFSGGGTPKHSDNSRLIIETTFLIAAILGSGLAVFYSRRAYGERTRAASVSLEEERLTDLITNLVLEPAVTAALQISWQDAETDRVSLRNGRELSAKTEVANLIATETKRSLAIALDRSHGAAVGLAGPRGSGKTELARMFTEWRLPESQNRTISLMLQAPTEYDAHTFLLRLLKELCKNIINVGYGSREVGDSFSSVQGRRQLLAVCLVGGSLISCGLLGLLVILTGVKVSAFAPYAICGSLILAGVAVLASRVPRSQRWARNMPISQRTIEHAKELRTRAEFTETYRKGSEVKVARGAFGASAKKEAEYSRIPLSEFDVVQELHGMVQRAAEDHWKIIVAIDELDRMQDYAEAMKFINRIKGLFPIHECSFIVSVAEDMWAGFESRGLPGRSVFTSSFDDVIDVEMLKPAESRDLLKRKSVNFTDAQALLCHCLSGGLPRDLIRAAVKLGEAADRLRGGDESKTPLLCEVIEKMLEKNLDTKLKASGMRNADDWQDIWPDPDKTEQRLADICRAGSDDDSTDPSSAASQQSELVAYIAVLHTIRQAFSPGGPLTDLMLKSPASDRLIDEGFHHIACARWWFLASDIDKGWKFLDGARKTLKLTPLQPAPEGG
jgi:Flp pilus assembly protein TadD